MLFTFKRDDEGRERMYVGNVCVFVFANTDDRRGYQNAHVPGVTDKHLVDAIERADEAGFWDQCDGCGKDHPFMRKDEVTVDVPVADSTVLSVTTVEDES
jgi:hypothetical protein